jgi:hypothetical protein
MGIVTLLIAAFIVWLGLVPGDPAPNRFGAPPPPGLTFDKPAKSD